MKELIEIISVVSRTLDVCKSDILYGHDHKSTKARQFVCHIIRDGFPHLMSSFIDASVSTKKSFYMAAKKMDELIEGVSEIRELMNKMRTKLKLIAIKDNKKAQTNISATKRMFGFDYTDAERLRMKRNMIASVHYMNKKCSGGKQPLQEGMVFSVRHP